MTKVTDNDDIGNMDTSSEKPNKKHKKPFTGKPMGPGTGLGPKRTPEQREADFERIGQMDRQGYTQTAIASVIGSSQAQVNYDLRIIRKRYAEFLVLKRKVVTAQKVEEYRDIRREAWEAYQKSKEPLIEEIEEQTITATGGYTKITNKTKQRLPDAAYLRIIADCLAAEREMQGIDAPKRLNLKAAMASGIDFDAFADGPATEELEDVIEAEIEQLEAKALPAPNPTSTTTTNGQQSQSSNQPPYDQPTQHKPPQQIVDDDYEYDDDAEYED